MDLSYILNHLGEEDRAAHRGAVSPPIYQTAIFAFETVAAMRAGFGDELDRTVYTRGNNPTVEILRKKLAALEGAEDALLFGSGAAAIAAGAIACVAAGDHVVCVQKPYSWTRALVRDHLARFGVSHTFVDASDVADVEAALTPATRLIVLESPNTMTYEAQDLAAIAALARARGIRTLCDNSYATPLNQSPLALGIDLVAHSATKYLNGHCDVMAGVLCGSKDLIRETFRGPYMTLGAMLSPHDAWLMIRGLRTLPLRLRQIAATTARVIEFLSAHPKIERIWYPQAANDPQAQLRGANGLFSCTIRCESTSAIERFCEALRRFLMTVSWGGYESLVFPVATVYPPDTRTGFERAGQVPVNLVRLSIGLEEADVLIADLAQALDRV
ncbi:aminotransferase class I/II-fold pyridoxal phosphate-dependent enzyme [Tahibacter soli]|jgi:cystathionine beta-lyase/cystathionine gamma-synthase|uniref:Aminotransferase class I/II-fold pyridoxal phosphate-dependent enzyme n=1 Tax=Tahibacter soli TaxID=2983605 RepID=A0A9X3YLW1_9GAMM|nr:aminotransferase class I/II-fold pyridoxal phosphate-dependent enzyme [Tahibacter soli]MDC8013098.1 aminotransferase class I/II-fold pyridoxal phosphate-dependent enzyme [Tahibacter soli]